MNLSKFKIRFVLLLQLLFAGQVLASSVIHCPMMMQNSSEVSQNLLQNVGQSTINHSGMDHSKMSHAMNENISSDKSSMDCCSIIGDCEEGNCFSLSMMLQTSLDASTPLTRQVLSLPKTHIFRLHSNLYRPPIVA